MTAYSNVLCNSCKRRLTERRLARYPLTWQHSGDMYCRQCGDERVDPEHTLNQDAEDARRDSQGNLPESIADDGSIAVS